MGKLQSKHVCRTRGITEAECFLVNAQLNRALEEELWKKKTGFNLANYNMDQSISELSICIDDKQDNIPLRVTLPPKKISFDQDGEKKEDTRLNIEEFECGVQFEGSEKQEWSFTLYDFDGQGKITKEDLASLLKALYDAVGSSIKLPSQGTKTLKLRLTVGQDPTQVQAKTESATPPPKTKVQNKDTINAKTSPKKKEILKLNNLTQNSLAKCNNETQGQSSQRNRMTNITTQEQQQLVELVQENMERNHIKHLRRHHSDCRALTHEQCNQKRRHKIACQNNQGERAKESQDRRNYYLDLAGIENNSSKFQATSSTTAQVGSPPHSHQRSRSHDVGQKCDNVQKGCEQSKHLDGVKNERLRSRSNDPQETATKSPKVNKTVHGKSSPFKNNRYRPVSLPAHVPEATTPHYHRRHHHREKDHGLAMQQVAEWIEREHTVDVDGKCVIIQRHEHHHVHEHHHHYHHYQET